MGREPVEQTILGLKVTCVPLPFPISQEMVPEVAEFLALAIRELGTAVAGLNLDDPKQIAAAMGRMDPKSVRSLLDTLNRNSRKTLQTTVVECIGKDGELTAHELSKKADYEWVFNEQPELWLPLVLLAGRVTFKRFFPVAAPGAGGESGSS